MRVRLTIQMNVAMLERVREWAATHQPGVFVPGNSWRDARGWSAAIRALVTKGLDGAEQAVEGI